MSLPVRGARIETHFRSRSTIGLARRSPCGGRGLKHLAALESGLGQESLPVRGARIETPSPMTRPRPGLMSLPVRGARIETPGGPQLDSSSECRSPCGGRGLKLEKQAPGIRSIASLPVRGARIETRCGAWVASRVTSRSPCGGRGLKQSGHGGGLQ